MKNAKLFYYISTGLVSALMLTNVVVYVFKNEHVSDEFQKLGFPLYIIYPLAVAKLLGVIALWAPVSKELKQWAYAGFTFNFLLAFSATLNAGDDELLGPIVALVLLFVSLYFRKRNKQKAS